MGRKSDKDLPLAETLAHPVTPAQLAAGSTIDATPHPEAKDTEVPPLRPGAKIEQRYVVDSVLGSGGMGTVYLARDISLGRDVALKLHRSGTGHERLYREAIAMAQLAHPNVVTVFEVGTVDDQLFVAMEYIRGKTLRDWVAGKSWRQIAMLLVEVGEGLAAAHRAGLVHRDFKPENVLVGEDGRPRVSDFGLARANVEVTASLPPSVTPRSPSHRSNLPLTPTPTTGSMTATGAILGTPAYMPPEQYAGAEVDARSDQFAFCVAAWESLYGKRPFPGNTLPQLQQAIERGKVHVPESSPVPASVRRALLRGLSAQPEARWPDMPSLLAALRAAAKPRDARWIAAGVLGAFALAGGATWLLMRSSEPSCDGAGDEIDRLLPATLRDEVTQFAKHLGGADPARRANSNIGGFVLRYRMTATKACRAVAHHDWSDALEDRSRACREQQARIAASSLRTAMDDTTSARRAVALSADLDEIADLAICEDSNALAAMPKQPPEHGDELAQARADLLAARQEAGGKLRDKANATIQRISSSPIGSAPQLAATLALVRASIARADEDFATAIREATDAYYKAHEAVDQTIEVEALRDLLTWIGTDRQDNAAVEQWYRLALAEVSRFAKVSTIAATRLRTALVGVAEYRNELPVAIEQARTAVDAMRTGPMLVRANALREYAGALAAAGDGKHAIPLYEQTAALVEEAFGGDDPQLAAVYGDEALTLSEAGQHAEAVKVGERAMAVIAKQPAKTIEGATVELNFAAVLLEADKSERAEQLLLDARQTFEKTHGADNPTIATIDSNLSLIESDRGHYQEAAKLLRSAIAIQEKSLGADNPEVANSLYNLAAALKETDDLAGALEAATRCVAIRAKSVPNSDVYLYSLAMKATIENRGGDHAAALRDASTAMEIGAPRGDYQTTAWPKLEQGRALVALGRDRETGRRLLGEARAAYAANKNDKRVAEIDMLLAK